MVKTLVKYPKSLNKREPWNSNNSDTKLSPSEFTKTFIDIVSDEDNRKVDNNALNSSINSSFMPSIHSLTLNEPIFQSSPKTLIFTNYQPFQIYEKKLYFRNNDKISHKLKISYIHNNPYYEISTPKQSNGEDLKHSKIASGMEIYYIIRFKPQEYIDYSLDLSYSSDNSNNDSINTTYTVPIRSICMIPQLSFPDSIDFGTCQVKSTTRRSILIYNKGINTVSFTLHTQSKEFTCITSLITIEKEGSYLLEVDYTPILAKLITSYIEIEYTPTLKCYIKVIGTGLNASVFLTTPAITLDPCYISLTTTRTLYIKNTSEYTVDYIWKSFATIYDEESEKNRLLNEINHLEEQEYSVFYKRIASGYYNTNNTTTTNNSTYNNDNNTADIVAGVNEGVYTGSETENLGFSPVDPDNDNDDNNNNNISSTKSDIIWYGNNSNTPTTNTTHKLGNADVLGQYIPDAARGDEAILMRKYYNLRKALEIDNMLYIEDYFIITPISGKIYPHTDCEVTISFTPDSAAKFTSLAYLEVSGCQDRLSLHMNGMGIGPQVGLSFEILNLGDVYINNIETFEITLINKGDIPATWHKLSSNSGFGTSNSGLGHIFRFSSEDGYLQPGESVTIVVNYSYEYIGKFNELFKFSIQGNDNLLICQVIGEFIGPTFHFDCTSIKYGLVTYECLHSSIIRLVNTSKIPMEYLLHIPEDIVHPTTVSISTSSALLPLLLSDVEGQIQWQGKV